MTEYNNQQQHLQNDEYENGSGLTLHDLLQMVLPTGTGSPCRCSSA